MVVVTCIWDWDEPNGCDQFGNDLSYYNAHNHHMLEAF